MRISGIKEEIAPWLADDRSKVRAFAERYIRQISAEQRRAQEGNEMRKREYGETNGDENKTEDGERRAKAHPGTFLGEGHE